MSSREREPPTCGRGGHSRLTNRKKNNKNKKKKKIGAQWLFVDALQQPGHTGEEEAALSVDTRGAGVGWGSAHGHIGRRGSETLWQDVPRPHSQKRENDAAESSRRGEICIQCICAKLGSAKHKRERSRQVRCWVADQQLQRKTTSHHFDNRPIDPWFFFFSCWSLKGRFSAGLLPCLLPLTALFLSLFFFVFGTRSKIKARAVPTRDVTEF